MRVTVKHNSNDRFNVQEMICEFGVPPIYG